jgi:hypothetical protein
LDVDMETYLKENYQEGCHDEIRKLLRRLWKSGYWSYDMVEALRELLKGLLGGEGVVAARLPEGDCSQS